MVRVYPAAVPSWKQVEWCAHYAGRYARSTRSRRSRQGSECRANLCRPSGEVRPEAYCQKCHWPVVVSGDRVLLLLGDSMAALVLPGGLVDAVTPILAARDRPLAVSSHRYCWLASRLKIRLPWPDGVHTIGAVPLPPTTTALGPVRWLKPPHDDDLAGCREIDLFGTVRTVLAGAHANGTES
jgi:hypothetical protein